MTDLTGQAVADLVGAFDLQPASARHAGPRFDVGEHPIAAKREGVLVRPDQLLIALATLDKDNYLKPKRLIFL